MDNKNNTKKIFLVTRTDDVWRYYDVYLSCVLVAESKEEAEVILSFLNNKPQDAYDYTKKAHCYYYNNETRYIDSENMQYHDEGFHNIVEIGETSLLIDVPTGVICSDYYSS